MTVVAGITVAERMTIWKYGGKTRWLGKRIISKVIDN
jgi:hypothetical protein